MKTDSGDSILDSAALTDHVQTFYVNLFSKDDQCDLSLALKGMSPSLNSHDFNATHVSFLHDEIKKAFFDMGPFKSPCPYSLHVSFFQRLWSVVGKPVIDYAIQFFETSRLPAHINETLLVLIPKVDHPEPVK